MNGEIGNQNTKGKGRTAKVNGGEITEKEKVHVWECQPDPEETVRERCFNAFQLFMMYLRSRRKASAA